MTRTPLLLFLIATTACVGPRRAPTPRRAPNIVVIFTDDHANAAIGAYGSAVAHTPHLDRLAAEGVLFERAFCTNSICAPSRAVMLTGRHSHLNGVRDNGGFKLDHSNRIEG